jgi:hypothetical protein
MESEEKSRDFQKENSILRESNNKLLDSAYDLERERQFHACENALKVQVAQLETTLKSDLNEKKILQDSLIKEREQYAKIEAEFQDLQVRVVFLFLCARVQVKLYISGKILYAERELRGSRREDEILCRRELCRLEGAGGSLAAAEEQKGHAHVGRPAVVP